MKKKRLYCLFFSLFFIFSIGFPAFAGEMNFVVKTVIPDNQIDKNQTYFDLRMAPGQEQDLSVEMSNSTSKDITVSVNVNTAITNSNGVVEYNNNSTKRDSSLKISFKDIAKTDKEVTIPANSTKTQLIHIQMPKDEYDGTILGGIYFTENTKEDDKDKNSKGSQIINKYAYVVGVKLTENDNEVKPELRLNSVKASQENYRNIIAANIQNYNAAILKDLKVEGKIYKKGSDEVLYSATNEDLRMAPNSNFDFGISLDNKPFRPGKYTFKGVATSGVRKWTFEKDFEIKSGESNRFNKSSVSLEKDNTWLYILIVALVLFVLLIIIWILIRKIRKSNVGSEDED